MMSEQKPLIEQIEFFEILAPAKVFCQVNNRGYCQGCFRSREGAFNGTNCLTAKRNTS